MTAQGSRRTILLFAFAALALLAWWWGPRIATTSPTVPARLANAARAETRLPAASIRPREHVSLPAGADAFAGATAAAGDAREVACRSANRQRLRVVRAALDPARSAQDAFAHALLGEVLAIDGTLDGEAQRRAAARQQAEWQAARRQWPGDIDIAWQAANHCLPKLGCDGDDALRHLLDLDPGNAAAWWLAMQGAWGRGDTAAYDDALAHAAASRGSDARTGSVFLALRPLLAKAPMADGCVPVDTAADVAKVFGHAPTAADWASVEAWSYELASNSPVSHSAFSGCREREAGTLPQRRREDCIASLSVLAGGDTLIEQSVALPLLIQLSGDSAKGLAYRERYRRTLYLFLAAPPMRLPGDPASMLSVGEVETMRRAAIARHRWPPPADWLPLAARQRMLVTRGRLPADGG